MDLTSALASRLRRFWLDVRGVRFEGRAWLRAIEVPHARGITLGDGVALDRGVTLLTTNDAARIVIGARTYVNRAAMFDSSELIEIGADAMIGPFCYLTDHDHTAKPGARPADGALVAKATRVGARCWLGAHVTVLKGVEIGEGSVVGAGSVVTKSLPSCVIAIGNPARVLRAIGA
jgi:acetyltransferase-like isoleucine patch superfamily enzyme